MRRINLVLILLLFLAQLDISIGLEGTNVVSEIRIFQVDNGNLTIRVVNSSSSPLPNVSVYVYKAGSEKLLASGKTDSNGVVVFDILEKADIALFNEFCKGGGKVKFNLPTTGNFTIVADQMNITLLDSFNNPVIDNLIEVYDNSTGELACLGYTNNNGKLTCGLNSSKNYKIVSNLSLILAKWLHSATYNKTVSFGNIVLNLTDLESYKPEYFKYRRIYNLSGNVGWNISLPVNFDGKAFFDNSTNKTDVRILFNNSKTIPFKFYNLNYSQGSNLASAELIFYLESEGSYYIYYGYPDSDLRVYDFEPPNWKDTEMENWTRRRLITLEDIYGKNHTSESVRVNISGDFLQNCKDLRLVNSSNEEINYKILSTDNSTWCEILFPATVIANNKTEIYAYYSNPDATEPGYNYQPDWSNLPSNQSSADKGDGNLNASNSFDLLLDENGGNVITTPISDTNYEESNLIDGENRTDKEDYKSTTNITANSFGNIIELNFSEANISHLVIRQGTNGATKVKINISLDGTNWEQILEGTWKNGKGDKSYVTDGIFNLTYNGTNYTSSNKNEIFFEPRRARYIRLDFYVPNTTFSLDEIELYGGLPLKSNLSSEEKNVIEANYTKLGEAESLRIEPKNIDGSILETNVSLNQRGYWRYRRNISLEAGVGEFVIDLKINSTKLLEEGKVLSDGQDIRVLNGDGKEIKYLIENWNSSETHIIFIANLTGSAENYALLYGNPFAEETKKLNYSEIPNLLVNYDFENGTNNWSLGGTYNETLTGLASGYEGQGYRIAVDSDDTYAYLYQSVAIGESSKYWFAGFLNQSIYEEQQGLCLSPTLGGCENGTASTKITDRWIFISNTTTLGTSSIKFNLRVENGSTVVFDNLYLAKTINFTLGNEENVRERLEISKTETNSLGWAQFAINNTSELYSLSWSKDNLTVELEDIQPLQVIKVRPFTSEPVFDNVTTLNLSMSLKINVSKLSGDLIDRNISNVWVVITKPDLSTEIVNLSGNVEGGEWTGTYIPDLLGEYRTKFYWNTTGGDIAELRMGKFEVRRLVIDEWNFSNNKGYDKIVYEPEDEFNVTVCIREYNGSHYWNITSGEWTIKSTTQVAGEYQYGNLTYLYGCYWRANFTAPSKSDSYTIIVNGTADLEEIYGKSEAIYYVNQRPQIDNTSVSVTPDKGYYDQNFIYNVSIYDPDNNVVNVSLFTSTDNKTTWVYRGYNDSYTGGPFTPVLINTTFNYTDVGTDNWYKFQLDDGYFRFNTSEFKGPSEIKDRLVLTLTKNWEEIYRNDSFEPHNVTFTANTTNINGTIISEVLVKFYINSSYIGNCTTDSNGICNFTYNPEDTKGVGNYTILANATSDSYDPSSEETWILIKGKLYPSITNPNPGETLLRGVTYNFNSTTTDDNSTLVHPNTTWYLINSSGDIVDIFGENEENLNYTLWSNLTNGTYYIKLDVSKNYYDSASVNNSVEIRYRSAVNITDYPLEHPRTKYAQITARVYDFDNQSNISSYTVYLYIDNESTSHSQANTDSDGLAYLQWNPAGYNLGNHTVKVKIEAEYVYVPWIEQSNATILLKGILYINITEPPENQIFNRGGTLNLTSKVWDDQSTENTTNPYNVSWILDGSEILTQQNGTWNIPWNYEIGEHNLTAIAYGENYDNGTDWEIIRIFGYSKVENLTTDKDTYLSGEKIKITCSVRDANTSELINNYPVKFYFNGTYKGTNLTNNGTASFEIENTTGIPTGYYNVSCEIEDNATLFYNISENYWLDKEIEIQRILAVRNLTASPEIVYRNDNYSPYEANLTAEIWDGAIAPMENATAHFYLPNNEYANCTTNSDGICSILWNPANNSAPGNYTIYVNATKPGSTPSDTANITITVISSPILEINATNITFKPPAKLGINSSRYENITISSEGDCNLTNITISCISGTICQNFTISFSSNNFDLVNGSQKEIKINLTVPSTWNQAGDFNGTLKIESENKNYYYPNKTTKYINLGIHIFEENVNLEQVPQSIYVGSINETVTEEINLTVINLGTDNITEVNLTLRFVNNDVTYNDMVIYPESQSCGTLNSGENCTKTFYINISPTTSDGSYEIIGKVSYKNLDNSYGNKTNSTTLDVGVTYSFERVPEEITNSVAHGSSKIVGYINVTNTGNSLLTINLSISGGNLPGNLSVIFNPEDYKLSAGYNESSSVKISVPLGQDPGEYITNITIATDNAGNKTTFLNITVPVDNSWNRTPDYIDRTGNNSIGLDSTGKFEINISNTGNVDTNFSIEKLNPPTCLGKIIDIDYPKWIFINKTSSDILEIDYQAIDSGNCVFDIQIKNQEDGSTKITTINATVTDIPPTIYEFASWQQYRDVNYEEQIIRVNISDNHPLGDTCSGTQGCAWLNITGAETKIVNMSVETNLSECNYTFIGNFTPTKVGTYYFVIYAKDNAGQITKSATYQFNATGSTTLEITTNTSRQVAGVTNTTGKCFNQEFNLTNLGFENTGYGGAYYTNLSVTNLPSGWNATPSEFNYGKITGGETKTDTTQICVPAGTYTGNYSFTLRADWMNPNNSVSHTTKTINVEVLPSPNLEVAPSSIAIDDFQHGTTREVNWTLLNTGNLNATNIQIQRADNISVETTISPSSISNLGMGESKLIVANISVPLGFVPGSYQLKINHSCSDAEVLEIINLTVLENKSWKIVPTKISKLVAINSSGKFGEINLSNLGNVQLNFNLNISGNISSYLEYPSSVSVSKQNYTIVTINYTEASAKADYSGILNISQNATDYLEINLSLGIRNLELDLLNYTNETNSSQPLEFVVNLTYDYNPVSSASFEVKVGNKECTNLDSSYSENLWYLSCISPELKDGYYYDLTIIATANVSGSLIEATLSVTKGVHYQDLSPPIIENISAKNIEVTKEDEKVNQTIEANISDATKVENVSIVVTKDSQVVYSGTMINKTNKTFVVNITNLTIGDYDFNITATDVFGYKNSTLDWFEIYIAGVYLQGNLTNTTEFKFYRPGKNFESKYEILSFIESGSYKEEVHKRTYDLKLTACNHVVKMRNVNITQNLTDPIKLACMDKPLEDGVEKSSEATEHGIIYFKKVLGIENKLNFSQAEITMNSGDRDPNLLYVYKCENWNYDARECNGSWVEYSGTIVRTANAIKFNVSSFSAYALVEISCPSPNYVLCGGKCYLASECPYCCNGVCSLTECTQQTGGGAGGGGGGGGGGYVYVPPEEKKAVCGNGVCEATESWENCPEDCKPPLPPSTVTSNIVDVKLHPGESKTYSIWITNNLNKPQTAYLSASGTVWEFIQFDNTIISIPKLSTKTVKVVFATRATTQPGIYTGDINVLIGNKTHTIPVTLTVVPEEYALLDVKVEALTKQITKDEVLQFYVSLYNLGIKKRVDVTLNYLIKNLESNEILSKKEETMALETSLSFIRTYDISNLSLAPGKYYISVLAIYENKTASSADLFEVIVLPWWHAYIPLIIATLITAVALIYALKLYKKKVLERLRYLCPVDYDSLPKEGLELGKIAETNRKAYLDKDDLTTHVITAGATGSGKTVSAMVIAEEVLKQKIPVIVFDPTGQWTGFVRPCRDKKMLSKYKEFGLSEEDARSFPGMIYEVTDPEKKIDLRKYLNPGEITIFTLNKLKPGEYDIAVQNIVNTIFEQEWEETTELRVLIVFDEVHRLLERYGGKGGYIVLEKAAREFRKWGLGIIMISQVLSDFKEALKGNVLTEIQMNTKALEDLKRAREKYGEEYARRITREEVGVGMIQNPKYNEGKPYWIAFRPLLHDPHKIPDTELELYTKYSKELEIIEAKIEELRRKGEDTFDLDLELRLAKDKLKQGKFRMAEIYVNSLKGKLGITG